MFYVVTFGVSTIWNWCNKYQGKITKLSNSALVTEYCVMKNKTGIWRKFYKIENPIKNCLLKSFRNEIDEIQNL